MKFLTTLLLALALIFGAAACKNSAKKDKEKQAALTKKPKKDEAKLREDSDADFETFVARLRRAVHEKDMNTLAGMMTTDFGYSYNPRKEGDGVFKFWDDQNLWPELDGILSEKFVKKKDFMVAPPQFADESLNYDGYRAGIRKVNGTWKFCYFVNGS